MNILIINNNKLIVAILANLIRKCADPKHIYKSYSISCAKKWLKGYNVNIVFLDASIESSLDGIDLFKEIKSNNAQLPVVVMTSKNNSGVISKVLDISAGDYLVQPLSIKKIHHCLFNIKNKPYSLSGESV